MAIETYGCNESKSVVPIATQPVRSGGQNTRSGDKGGGLVATKRTEGATHYGKQDSASRPKQARRPSGQPEQDERHHICQAGSQHRADRAIRAVDCSALPQEEGAVSDYQRPPSSRSDQE